MKYKLILSTVLLFGIQNFVLAGELTQKEPILPIPLQMENLDSKKIELGMRLFNDTSLSENRTVSCASCHRMEKGGTDGLAISVGINGGLGEVNAPTVLNSVFNFKQFWNGRAKNLEEQIEGPIHNKKEMGTSWAVVLPRLLENKSYVESFQNIYQSKPTAENVKDAIAEFEKALFTPNSRFDQFLRGNQTALSSLEHEGYKKFKAYGCVSCHQGMNIGGNMFQTMGVMGDYFKDRKTPITEADYGRFNVTKKESDKFAFKVPSLRNVELTAPYFHDGSAKTLDQAVRLMAKYQLGLDLPKKEVDAFVAFLKALTGETPAILRKSESRQTASTEPKR